MSACYYILLLDKLTTRKYVLLFISISIDFVKKLK